VRVHAAGRTDAGVHATAQVAHFDTEVTRDPRAWLLGVNAELPPEVAITWVRTVPDDFHARFAAIGRRYCYLIHNRRSRSALLRNRVCWECRPLAVPRMALAAEVLIGTHDFSAFRGSGCQARSPVRTLRSLQLRQYQDLCVLEVEADGFLLHMVRNIAGVLMAVGRGEAAPDWVATVLASRDRRAGGVTADPAGLYLTEVRYPAHFAIPPGNDFPFTRSVAQPLFLEPGREL
jgi:tRNA pseudouridine38-40 synthase